MPVYTRSFTWTTAPTIIPSEIRIIHTYSALCRKPCVRVIILSWVLKVKDSDSTGQYIVKLDYNLPPSYSSIFTLKVNFLLNSLIEIYPIRVLLSALSYVKSTFVLFLTELVTSVFETQHSSQKHGKSTQEAANTENVNLIYNWFSN